LGDNGDNTRGFTEYSFLCREPQKVYPIYASIH
jgi:hypothetical protein